VFNRFILSIIAVQRVLCWQSNWQHFSACRGWNIDTEYKNCRLWEWADLRKWRSSFSERYQRIKWKQSKISRVVVKALVLPPLGGAMRNHQAEISLTGARLYHWFSRVFQMTDHRTEPTLAPFFAKLSNVVPPSFWRSMLRKPRRSRSRRERLNPVQ